MTKREMFATIRNYFENAVETEIVTTDPTKTIPTDEILNFCDHEIELLSKKSSSGAKPTKIQIENEGHKDNILDILAENDKPMTISDLMEDSRLEGLKNQRVSALVTQLKKDGLVIRTEVKKKAYFSLAEVETPKE